jgi:AraC-like DNA-binding protein
MSFRYFTPPASQPFVRSFSILEESQAAFNNRIILPDPYPALVINFGAPFACDMGQSRPVELPRAFLTRAQTEPPKVQATGPCHAIILSLHAWGARFLVGEQIDLAATPIVSLAGVGRDLIHLLEHTLRHRGDTETLSVLAQFVGDLRRCPPADPAPIRAAVELLNQTQGQCTVNEIAAHCFMSVSQLERHAKYFTGCSPKALARLIRFDAACAGLLHDSSSRLTDLAHESGFVDQAHFIHEFQSLAACTPREARDYVRWLAADAEFLQLS